MNEKAPRRHFQTIEGMRAAGAALIVMRHVPGLFGYTPVPESFLAVATSAICAPRRTRTRS